MDNGPAGSRNLHLISKDSDTDQPVDSISEINLNPYVLTNYEVGDNVLRRYPATKIGHSPTPMSMACGGVDRT